MTATPFSLLDSFLSLYGIDAAEVSTLSLDPNTLHVTELVKPIPELPPLVREVTIRNWRDIPVPDTLPTPPAPAVETPTEAESDSWCPHGLHRDITCEHCDAEAADAALHYAG